jgi:hypothetical protein
MSIKSKFPNIKPSLNLDFANTKQLDPRITFTRASTATYWDGVTQAKAEENLLKYSQDFDNAAWGQVSVTVTANTTTAPDGTSTADSLVTASGSSGIWYLQQIPAVAAPAMFSIYAKANTANHLGVSLGNTGVLAGVDLSTGTVTLQGTGCVVTSASMSGGWHRIAVAVAGGSDRVRIFASTASITVANQSVTGDGISGIYIWGAQLEQRSQVTAYIPTTDRPITKYQPVLQTAPSGVPRFDHNPVTGESLGLLIEEQRTNLVTQSAVGSGWISSNVTRYSNNIVAPDGVLAGTTLQATAGAWANRGYYQAITVTAGAKYTASVYARAGTYGYLYMGGSAFNVSNGTVMKTVVGGSATITDIGGGWYRCVSTYVTASVTDYFVVYFADASGNGAMVATGGETLNVWGAQLEAGAFPTSYIPTTAAQVTRAADAAVMAGANFSSWFRQDEGTFFMDSYAEYGGNVRGIAGIDGNGHIAFINPNGTVSCFDTAQITATGTYFPGAKITTAYGSGSLSISLSGSIPVAGSFSTPYGNASALSVGILSGSSYSLNGTIKKLSYYPKRLSNTELQALTA